MKRAGLTDRVLAARYRLQRLLGSGAIGDVYLAEHLHLGRRFAVKVLREVVREDETALERFRQEARIASRLDHPNIVYVADFGHTEEGEPYLVMEYIEGKSLRVALRSCAPGRLFMERALRLLVQICGGVAAAHEARVVHRDLKPENILLTKDRAGREMAKILDFGLAKIMSSVEVNPMTRRGEVFGTPAYMAPEQTRGESVDPQADVYALGVIAFELLTGRLPFVQNRIPSLLRAIRSEAPPRPSALLAAVGASIPPDLEWAVLSCLEKDPRRRPQGARVLADAAQAALKRPQLAFCDNVVTLRETRLGEETRELDWQEATRELSLVFAVDTAVERDPRATTEEAPDQQQIQEWLWTQVAKKARSLGQFLLTATPQTAELSALLGELERLEEELFSLEADVAAAEARAQEIEDRLRAGDDQIRHAIVDLGLERDRLLAGGAAPERIEELDAQMHTLERHLSNQDRLRQEKLSAMDKALQGRIDRAAACRQRQTEEEFALLDLLHRLRPRPASPHLQHGYEEIEALLRAMPGRGATPR